MESNKSPEILCDQILTVHVLLTLHIWKHPNCKDMFSERNDLMALAFSLINNNDSGCILIPKDVLTNHYLTCQPFGLQYLLPEPIGLLEVL